MNGVNSNKKILIMAGGTGGHVFPALAIAKFLQSNNVVVEWLGTERGLESTVIPDAGIPLNLVSIGGLRGKSLWRKVSSPLRILKAIFQSSRHIRRLKPDCVLGMGGFVTGPGGVAAWLNRVPLVIHEQNAIAGFTNLMLLPFATIAMEAFPDAFLRKHEMDSSFLSKRISVRNRAIAVVGNPVRKEINDVGQAFEDKSKHLRPRILVVGGSLGAVAINKVIPEVIAAFEPEVRPDVWHQCGDKNLEETVAKYQEVGLQVNVENDEVHKIKVSRFIENMAEAYTWADVVICRSGALTVSELAAAGLASILIPYPSAVDDHQTENADYLVRNDAAYLLPQPKLNKTSLGSLLSKLFVDNSLINSMSRKALALAKPDACELAGQYCLEVCHD